MNRAYTQMITGLRKKARITGRSMQSLVRDEADTLCKALEVPDSYNSPELTRVTVTARAAICEWLMEEGRGLHLFMPDIEFCDWLVACVHRLDPALIPRIRDGLGDDFVCLHFPAGKKRASSIVHIDETGNVTVDLSYDMHSEGIVGGLNFAGCIPSEAKDTGISEDNLTQLDWYVRFIAGLGLYLVCYPDQLINGVPQDLSHAGRYDGKVVCTLCIAEDLRDPVTHRHEGGGGGGGGTKSPHYRSCHFRTLTSAKFVNKQGQVVLVKGTFVKGHAKTVVGQENNIIQG